MHTNRIKTIPSGLLVALLLAVSMMSTACKEESQQVDITLITSPEALADAIGSMNRTLSEKLALIEPQLQMHLEM